MSKGYCPLESELCLRLFFILLMFSETGKEGGVEGEGMGQGLELVGCKR